MKRLTRPQGLQLLFLFMALFNLALSAEEEKGQLELQHDKADPFDKVLEIPEVKSAYNKCESQSKDPEKIESCMNDEIKKRPELLQQVQAALKLDKASKGSSLEGEQLIGKDINNIKTNYKQDESILAIEKYLQERLRTTLFLNKNNTVDTKKAVDHKIFYRLYKSQLGKNLVSMISSYCLDANHSVDFIIAHPDKGKVSYFTSSGEARSFSYKKTREENIDNLKEKISVQGKNNSVEIQNKAFSNWSDCAQAIPQICHEEKKYSGWFADQNSLKKASSQNDQMDLSDLEKSYNYSKNRACEVTGYIKAARQNIIKLDEIEKKFAEYDAEKSNSFEDIDKKVSIYSGKARNQKEKDIDELTSITSDEIIEDSQYKENIKEMKNKFDNDCLKSRSAAECDKYVYSKNEVNELNKVKTELDLREEAMHAKLAKLSDEETETFLKEEGYDEKQIENILKVKDLKKIKESIANRYKKEKEAIIQSLNEKIKKKTLDLQKVQDKSSDGTLQSISEEFKKRQDDLQQLVFYNNLVSGFLEVEVDNGGKSESSKNVKNIFRELKDSAYLREQRKNRTTANNKDGWDQFKDDFNLKESDDKDGNKELNVNTINCLLNEYNQKATGCK